MPLPPVATIAACGSILTACKSAWELSRMIKKKDQEKRLDSQARAIIYDLRRSYLDGHMEQKTFDKWYDRLLGAIAEKDGAELQKIKAHLSFLHRDKGRTSRHNTHTNSPAYSDEKHTHRTRTRSVDRRHSRGPPAVYTVEEYEEKRRRPSHVDTVKAQRDYDYAHALPSPYQSKTEHTPETDEFEDWAGSSRRDDGDRRSRHGGHHRDRYGSGGSHTESYSSRSNSTSDRGRTRSRSVHTEKRASETASSDADSEAESYYDRRRRSTYYAKGGGH